MPHSTTTMSLLTLALTLTVSLLMGGGGASAQVVPTSSIDPLMGSSFSTPVFTPANTFTPTTTFNSAGSRTPTSISGPGPSVDPASYTFSYDEPLSTVQGTPLSNLYSSLAANGTPTAATSPLFPDPSNLQIVPASTPTNGATGTADANAASSLLSPIGAAPISSILAAVAAGVAFVAFV